MSKTRVLIADDHQLVRQGLTALLSAESDLEIVGGVADGLEVVGEVEKIKPDVLILDLMMPGQNGLDIAYQLKKRGVNVRIIILSMHANEAYVVKAIRNGAVGYVLKDASSDELVKAIRDVMAGKTYLCEPFTDLVVESYWKRSRGSINDLYETLTTRERQVLTLAAEGYSNNEMAERLEISPRTVEVHRARIMDKLRLRNHAQLIKFTLQRGLIDLSR